MKFLTVEGLDGSGKSTLCRLLKSELKKRKVHVCQVYEPGTTPVGSKLRQILKSEDAQHDHPLVRALMFNAARVSALTLMANYAIREPETLFIADRHVDSTYAYQGLEGVSDQDLALMEYLATSGFPKPQLTLFLDVSPEICFERSKARRELLGGMDKTDAYDEKPLSFYQGVYDRYKTRIDSNPARFRMINATGTPLQALEQALDVVCPAFDIPRSI